jgi:hypothetical protein
MPSYPPAVPAGIITDIILDRGDLAPVAETGLIVQTEFNPHTMTMIVRILSQIVPSPIIIAQRVIFVGRPAES